MNDGISQAERLLTFGRGARGFIVADLQRALDIAADGEFGAATERRVRELQSSVRLPVTGRSGAREFNAAALPWPGEFERCMNLVSCFEGTSFGDCNATDIDGAGLTMGIAGFTSLHGEVQILLAKYFSDQPQDLHRLLPRAEAELLTQYLSRAMPHGAWRLLFYSSDGRVKPCWQSALRDLGRTKSMQQLQLHMACTRFWKPAVAAAVKLGFSSLRAKCFFLDVAVQNGGWRRQHESSVSKNPDWRSRNESARLVAAAQAVAACAKLRWQSDVMSRKLTIARGEGIVHEKSWNLAAQALDR